MSNRETIQKGIRETRAAAKALEKAGRELLDANADAVNQAEDPWARRLMSNLYKIACSDQSAQSLQALRLAIEVTTRRIAPRRKKSQVEEGFEDALLNRMSAEELDAEIAHMEGQLAMLKEAGIPSAQA